MSEVNSVELARLLFAADGQEEDNEPGGSFDTAGETVQQHFLILAEIAIKFLALEASEEPRPMDTAPKNGQMLRLLVDFDDLGFENTADPGWTIGFNSFDLNYDDEWHFVGWCWSHDHYTEGKGTPVGWLPLNSFPERIALKAENERLREVLGEALERLVEHTKPKFDKDATLYRCRFCHSFDAESFDIQHKEDCPYHQARLALTRAARSEPDWTPIDQIPEEWKDGRELLLYFRNGLVRLCFWDQARGGLWSVWPGREPARFPTHARLLPPPPKEVT